MLRQIGFMCLALLSLSSFTCSADEIKTVYSGKLGEQRTILSAKVTEFASGYTALELTYFENRFSSVQLCMQSHEYKAPIPATIVLIFNNNSVNLKASVECDYDSRGRYHGAAKAIVTLSNTSNSDLWNALFPARADGSREYSLSVAVLSIHGTWDSNSGQNYSLTLK